MKNKKIIFLSLGLLLIVTTLVVSISAWLTDTDDTGTTIFTIGDVSYELKGDFITNPTIVVPGQQLIDTAFSLDNESTVTSELRLRVYLKVTNGETTKVEHLQATPTQLSTYFTTNGTSGGNFVLPNVWTFNAADNYWYYAATSGNNPEIVPPLPEITNIPILSSLMFDGLKVGNTFSTDVFEIVFTFEAKQQAHVGWGDLGGIDFSTGVPPVTP